jgi:hypothetical protein
VRCFELYAKSIRDAIDERIITNDRAGIVNRSIIQTGGPETGYVRLRYSRRMLRELIGIVEQCTLPLAYLQPVRGSLQPTQ